MIKQVLIALDQLINTLFLGMADETLSARCWRNKDNSWYWSFLRKLVDAIFFFDKDHCFNSYRSEIFRRHLPNHYSERA